MADLTLRAATVADVPEVLALWHVAAENNHRPADSAQAIEAVIARDPAALVLAVADGTVVGSVIAGWDGWRCHVYRLAVAPTHRRQGIGRVLIEAAEGRFQRLGGSRVDAMVLDDNRQAHAAWLASGYASQPEWSRWVKTLPAP